MTPDEGGLYRCLAGSWISGSRKKAVSPAPSGSSVCWCGSTARFSATSCSRRSAKPCRAEPARATFFEKDGQVFQRPVDYSDLELPYHDLRDADDPEHAVREMASAIQHTPLPLTGRLVKFALFRTGDDDQYYIFGLGHPHLRRRPGHGPRQPPHRHHLLRPGRRRGDSARLLRLLRDLVELETGYAASGDFQDDQTYWSQHLPPESGLDQRRREAAAGHDAYTRPRPSSWIRPSSDTSGTLEEPAHPPVFGVDRGNCSAGPGLVGQQLRSGARFPGQPPRGRRVEDSARDARRRGPTGAGRAAGADRR